jgi:hypothetical protein
LSSKAESDRKQMIRRVMDIIELRKWDFC